MTWAYIGFGVVGFGIAGFLFWLTRQASRVEGLIEKNSILNSENDAIVKSIHLREKKEIGYARRIAEVMYSKNIDPKLVESHLNLLLNPDTAKDKQTRAVR